jgi:hypothetical protein
MEKEQWSMKMGVSMKEISKMTTEKDMATRDTTILTSMWVTSTRVKLTEKGSIHGQIMSTMRETGILARNTALESGRDKMASVTMVIGLKAKGMELEPINGRMETSMKETGTKVSNMDTGRTHSRIVTHMKASTSTAKHGAKGTMFGETAQLTKVSLRRVINMVKGIGQKAKSLINAHSRAHI